MKDVFMPRSAGFTLLEVLVSIVILSIGLLGMAGLMAVSLKSSTTAYHRSQATVLADDILDRMRANLLAARAGDYDVALGVACTGSGIPVADCTEWKDTIDAALPGGDGSVLVAAGTVTIVIQWDARVDEDGDGVNDITSFTTVSQL
jgi:type IV pilus assembly protein PilV